MSKESIRNAIKVYTDHYGEYEHGWRIYHCNGDCDDVAPDNMVALPHPLYRQLARDKRFYPRSSIVMRLGAYLNFEKLKEEARERLRKDPKSNIFNMNLDLFDIDKILARPRTDGRSYLDFLKK